MQGFSNQTAPDGHRVQLFMLHNAQGCEAVFMDWGATWLSCTVPIAEGKIGAAARRREVLLRSPNLSEHLVQTAYFGATVGRYANRIHNAFYSTTGLADASPVQLLANEHGNSLHGGPRGYNAQRWQVDSHGPSEVRFRLISGDGDQGFPGALVVFAHYALTADNEIVVTFTARCDKPSPVNLTNHAYFNLGDNQDAVLEHRLQVSADRYLPVSERGIPIAGLKSVVNTSFDFRAPKKIGRDLLGDADQQRVAGYDHAFLLNPIPNPGQTSELTPAAVLEAPDGLLEVALSTTKPALQLYTGNHLGGVLGLGNQGYVAHAGVALETQFLPDSPNRPDWPHASCVLLPGEEYVHQTKFSFSCPSAHRLLANP